MTDNTNNIAITSPDLREERLNKLKALFPDLFDGEGQLDDKALKALVNEEASGTIERFRFEWAGKQKSKRFAFTPSKATLKYDPSRSINRDGSENKAGEAITDNTSQNLIIEGDNLEVLKLLQASYFEKVKCIYIDPPYNTGKDFIYPDDYSQTTRSYWESNGTVKGGVQLQALPESSGRRHSAWLNFIQSRLLLARNLLSKDGVLLMSIGGDEEHNLRKLADEIFGESNFVEKLVWAGGRKNDSRLISSSHEYILVYVRDKEILKEKKALWRQRKKGIDDIYKKYSSLKRDHGDDVETIQAALKDWFSKLEDGVPAKRQKHYSCVDWRGVYFPDNISWPGGGGPDYEVLHPKTGKPCKVPSRGWMFASPEKMQQIVEEDRVHFGADESAVPCIKSYLKDREYEVPYSVFYQDGRASTKRLRALLGGDYFEHPKDEIVLQELIASITYSDPEGIFVDFFAGTGTFAHSVLMQNALDAGKRKFVLVQVPETIKAIGSEKAKKRATAALKAGFNVISDITLERAKRAGSKIRKENPEADIDTGFRVLALDNSYFPENVFAPDPDKPEEENLTALNDHLQQAAQTRLFEEDDTNDLITEIALKNGYGLFYTLEVLADFADNTVYRLAGNDKATLLCMDGSLKDSTIEALKAHSEEQLIVLKTSLDTSKKFNLQTAFKENLQTF